jgi:hypothetical protein
MQENFLEKHKLIGQINIIMIMEEQLEQIREQQKAVWNKFSSGWMKWDELTM